PLLRLAASCRIAGTLGPRFAFYDIASFGERRRIGEPVRLGHSRLMPLLRLLWRASPRRPKRHDATSTIGGMPHRRYAWPSGSHFMTLRPSANHAVSVSLSA